MFFYLILVPDQYGVEINSIPTNTLNILENENHSSHVQWWAHYLLEE